MMDKGPPFYPAPHVGQACPPAYANEHHVPAPTTGSLSLGQSYLTPLSLPPPPPILQVHIAPLAHPFPSPQQNSQWTQNVQQVPPLLPPTFGRPPSSRNGPEILLPPPPPRLQPPPLSQGQALFGGSFLPPLPGPVQGIQHTPLAQPPLPNSTPYTHGHFVSVLHPISQDPHGKSAGLLPPPLPPSSPPGPPPLPPASPPPTSPSAHSRSTGAHLPSPPSHHHVNCDASSSKHFIAEFLDSDPKIPAPISDTSFDCEMETHLEVDSLVDHGSSSVDKIKFDLLPPPSKPGKERVAQKIEVLCQYISRNGPEFEEMTRKNEFGNPEFGFLFGGLPGSEAAAAHEYFLWMKKKCGLSCRVEEGKHHSNLSFSPIQHDVLQDMPLPTDLSARSIQLDSLMDADVSHSTADSDMDIEDEMPENDEKQKCCEFVEGVNDKSVMINSECEVEKQLHEPQIFAKNTAPEASISRNAFCLHTSVFVPHREDLNQPNASNAAKTSVDNESVSTELVKGTSAFKLLQDYASDDNSESDHEPSIEDSSPIPVCPTGKSASAHVENKKGSNFVIDETTKSTSESDKGLGKSSGCVVVLTASIPSKSLDSSTELQGASGEVDTTLNVKDKRHDNSHVNQQYIHSGITDKAFEQKFCGGSHVKPSSDIDKNRKEDGKYNSAQMKVDEFGRLVREGASDSDSDDLRYSKRHGKRDRSRSRSRSPYDRRSPQRRSQQRSRSRSWSPKKRRSRSRSPFRHGVQYGGDGTRRDKGPRPACFDYQRGKCFRGASCRYSHSDSTNGDLSRCYRSKYQTVPPSPKKTVKAVHEYDEVKSQEMQLCQGGSSLGASKDCNIYQNEVVMSARNISDKDVDLLISSVAESVRTREEAVKFQETQHTREDPVESSLHNRDDNICVEVGETPQLVDSYPVNQVTDVDARMLPPGITCHVIESSSDKSELQHLQANLVNQVLQNADYQPQHIDVPSAYNSQFLPASEANPNPLSVPEPHPDTIFDRSFPGTGSASKSYSPETFSTQHLRSGEPSPKNLYQPSQFPPPPPPTLKAANSPVQMPRDCSMMPQRSRYQSHPTPLDSFIPHQAPFPNQLTSLSGSANSAWNSLPPPPPRLRYVNDSTLHVSSSYGLPSSQFQENQLPLRNDHHPHGIVGPHPTEMHTHSQIGEFHRRTYPPIQEPNQPLSRVEYNKSTALPPVSTMTQQIGGPSAVREDSLRGLLGHGYPVSSAQSSMHTQPMPLSRGSPVGSMQSFGSNNLHSGELSSSSQVNSHLQQPSAPVKHLAANDVSVLGKPGKINSGISCYNSDYFERNLLSNVPDCVGSRIPTYYNPYTSSFEQPASSKVGLNVFNQAKGMSYSNNYGDPFSSSHVSADGRVVDSLDSKNVTCSTNSDQAVEKMLPSSSGDQYDPLFDSIEPSSNSFKTFNNQNNGQKLEMTDDSDVILRLNGSIKPLDLAENTKQRDSEPVAVTSSVDNDEYGETAEVGAVENGSPSDPIDEANAAAGEIEIDQVKTSGKSKKGKDSRSMKLFKIALADFVKEALKPSWRQGNMSKEAFKTIVKKTVDKVSGAMESHQVPKSQTKINHYITSSQRKLTKLVMVNLYIMPNLKIFLHMVQASCISITT